MGYLAPIDAIDYRTPTRPVVIDPTNPDGENTFRAVQTQAKGFSSTTINAYSGNNGGAAILNSTAANDAPPAMPATATIPAG